MVIKGFSDSTDQAVEIALTIYLSGVSSPSGLESEDSFKRYVIFRRSVPNGKRGVLLKVLHNFRTEFPENYLTI